MHNIVHSICTVLAPVITGRKLFYQLFYHIPADDLIASGLSEEVTP
jgi:hypothetical protein